MKIQLDAFYGSLISQGYRGVKPKNWFDAFTMLISLLDEKNNGERILIFIDELPWLDTAKSDFMAAFEWFWNSYAARKDNLMLIVCGSSTSWMLNNVINSHGGLYNRITFSIHLSPFTLGECDSFFKEKGYMLNQYTITIIYMVFGGIPYYLNYYENGKTIEQNIDILFNRSNGKLRNEYDNLFESSFDSDKLSKKIVDFLSRRKKGYSRKEFLTGLKMSDGDKVGKTLKALINSDFVLEYTPYGENQKVKYYKLIDPFCLFYLKNIKDNESISPSAFYDYSDKSWLGNSFENLCAFHLKQIKDALQINGIKTMQFSYFVEAQKEEERGAQIDLLIERKDKAIHLLEMKFYNEEFTVTKDYHFNLMNKIKRIKEHKGNKNDIYLSLVTTFGLKRNEYFNDFSSIITLNDLFK